MLKKMTDEVRDEVQSLPPVEMLIPLLVLLLSLEWLGSHQAHEK